MCPFDRQPRIAEKVSGRCFGDCRRTGAVRIFPPARKGAGGDRRGADDRAGVAAGGEAMMTSPAHQSGTDRIAEVASEHIADVYLGVQGDQPFIAPADLDALAEAMRADASIQMATLATPIVDHLEWTDPNKVKVVCGADGNALYFSRSPIPHARDGGMPKEALRHIGVYAYRRDFLMKFAALPMGTLERLEKLEQLRALEHGYVIRVVRSVAPSLEVDTADDLARARDTAADSTR